MTQPERAPHNGDSPEELGQLFRDVFDLIDDDVHAITDGDVDDSLRQVLAAAGYADPDDVAAEDPLEALRLLGQATAVTYTQAELEAGFAAVLKEAAALSDDERAATLRRVAELGQPRTPGPARRRRQRWLRYQDRCERLAGAPTQHPLLRGYLRALDHGAASVRDFRRRTSR